MKKMILHMSMMLISLWLSCTTKEKPSSAYVTEDGTPKVQNIPGKIQCEYYDTGGEGVAYHDSDSINSGSGGLNKGTDYYSTFRIDEHVDISFTKHYDSIDNNAFNQVDQTANELYVGWTVPGEWMNYTVHVEKTGNYKIGLMYTSHDDGKIRLITENNDIFVDLVIPTTYDDGDPLDWRQWHHWNYIDSLGTINLKKGDQTLRLMTLENGDMNYDYLSFKLL